MKSLLHQGLTPMALLTLPRSSQVCPWLDVYDVTFLRYVYIFYLDSGGIYSGHFSIRSSTPRAIQSRYCKFAAGRVWSYTTRRGWHDKQDCSRCLVSGDHTHPSYVYEFFEFEFEFVTPGHQKLQLEAHLSTDTHPTQSMNSPFPRRANSSKLSRLSVIAHVYV